MGLIQTRCDELLLHSWEYNKSCSSLSLTVEMWASPACRGEQGCGHPKPGWARKAPYLAVVSPGQPSRAAPPRWDWPMLLGELTSTEDPPLHAADLRSPTEFCAKNYQATRQRCYWVSKGQGDMLITFVFREMLIWNAQRVTLSITISAYIDYISA